MRVTKALPVRSARVFRGGVALLSVHTWQRDLDELVIAQRTVRFGHHRIGEAGIAHQDHGLERVRQSLEVAALFSVSCIGLLIVTP